MVSTSLEEAIGSLKNNKVIAFPTDTIYGLLMKYSLENALKLHQIKKRDKKKAFLILLPNSYLLEDLLEYKLTKEQTIFLNKYMPGRHTFVFEKKRSLAYPYSNTIAIRKPSKIDNLNLFNLLEEIKFPVLAPSLNFTGERPLNDINEIQKHFSNIIDLIFEDQRFEPNSVSSIWDLTKYPFQKIR